MRKYILLFVFIVIILISGKLYFDKYQAENIQLREPSQTNQEIDLVSTDKPTPTTSIGGYKTVWVSVRDRDKLFLFSNLSEKKSAKDIATGNSCLHLISGGFYDTERNHIGLLISEGQTLSESQENALFNGYFSVSKTGNVTITEYPVFSPRISLQTGPILLRDSKTLQLSLVRDENARRIVVGNNKEGSAVFIVVYDQKNVFSGPKLSELPVIIEKIDKANNLTLINAVNLDGGSHSAFVSDLANLNEASPIGSYFCIKP
jgi:uncharacterized protein YigE (DUF2233 family)